MISRTLKELLTEPDHFVLGAELVTTRGIILEEQGRRILELARELCDMDDIHFIDFTDNPGGNPMLLPESLGTELLFRGKNVMINLTCKDINRNGLESRAWKLASDGFESILCMSGDYPMGGYQGLAKPVFDIDSVGLISLLNDMNRGMKIRKGNKEVGLQPTQFHIGCVVSPFKKYENELLPQYFKLEKKILIGANYTITQIGYDSRKWHELLCYLKYRKIKVPIIANVYILNSRVAKIFHDEEVPGVVVSDELLEIAEQQGKSPDKGKSFFYELAAKQMVIAKGMGFDGVYLGGIHRVEDLRKLLELANRFSQKDWNIYAKEIQYPVPDTFYFFEKDRETGLNHPDQINRNYLDSLSNESRKTNRTRVDLSYKLSRWIHDRVFESGTQGYITWQKIYKNLDSRHPLLDKTLYEIEKLSKVPLFDCRDCGDCSLPEIAYLCPESQCVKNQRNGPCGGTRHGLCEVENGKDCIWSRAYDRMKPYGEENQFVNWPVVIKNNALEGTSAWKNTFLQRDHYAKINKLKR